MILRARCETNTPEVGAEALVHEALCLLPSLSISSGVHPTFHLPSFPLVHNPVILPPSALPSLPLICHLSLLLSPLSLSLSLSKRAYST